MTCLTQYDKPQHPVNTQPAFNRFLQAKKASQQAAAELGIKWLDTCVRRLLPERIRVDQVRFNIIYSQVSDTKLTNNPSC